MQLEHVGQAADRSLSADRFNFTAFGNSSQVHKIVQAKKEEKKTFFT